MKNVTLVDKAIGIVLSLSHNIIRKKIIAKLAKEKIIIQSIIGQSESQINISFDIWRSNSELSLLEVVGHFLIRDIYELKTFLFALSKIKNHSEEKQARVLTGVLNDYGIDANKLGWFILDNTSNNDITLFELYKNILFNPQKKQLHCKGYMINLITNVFFITITLKI